MQNEMDSLRHYEEEQEAFAALREAFDREVVYNDKAPSTDEYLKWYESMYPNNAAKIYEELLEKQMIEDNIQQYADYLAKMEGCTKRAVKFSVDLALQKLKEKI